MLLKVRKLTLCTFPSCQKMSQSISIISQIHSNFLQSFMHQLASDWVAEFIFNVAMWHFCDEWNHFSMLINGMQSSDPYSSLNPSSLHYLLAQSSNILSLSPYLIWFWCYFKNWEILRIMWLGKNFKTAIVTHLWLILSCPSHQLLTIALKIIIKKETWGASVVFAPELTEGQKQ